MGKHILSRSFHMVSHIKKYSKLHKNSKSGNKKFQSTSHTVQITFFSSWYSEQKSITSPPPTHHPCATPIHRPMHGPPCPSKQTPIWPFLTFMHLSYTILLLYFWESNVISSNLQITISTSNNSSVPLYPSRIIARVGICQLRLELGGYKQIISKF